MKKLFMIFLSIIMVLDLLLLHLISMLKYILKLMGNILYNIGNGKEIQNKNVMMVQFGVLDGLILNLELFLLLVHKIKVCVFGRRRNLLKKMQIIKKY